MNKMHTFHFTATLYSLNNCKPDIHRPITVRACNSFDAEFKAQNIANVWAINTGHTSSAIGF
jgi:hypothetical protein